MKKYSVDEIKKHSTPDDCWIVIKNKVYDVTSFLGEHPGGRNVIIKLAGKDATKKFETFHNVEVIMREYGERLCIGEVDSSQTSQSPSKKLKIIPYSEPSWYHGPPSPYYNETHVKFRNYVRDWVDREIVPHVEQWDINKRIDPALPRKFAEAGLLGSSVAGRTWPVEYCGPVANGLFPNEKYDAFHSFIVLDELSRCSASGVVWGLVGGLGIGLPPIMHFGSDYLKEKVCGDCLNGRKTICLAITEPDAGSDVAQLKCEAIKTPDGRFYIVNGVKKWITNGTWADYFTVAVRTGGEGSGMLGLSLLLIERDMPGVTTRQMNCQGVFASGTSYITFEDVKVPVENLIGEENLGFKSIMFNFNGERWGFSIQANRMSRICLSEAYKYALKRKTFGKRLIDHAVIRNKIAHMVRMVESTHSWLEALTYQLQQLLENPRKAMVLLGSPIAIAKAQASQTLEYCAREASQIFGGLSYTRGGQGGKVERIYRSVRAYAIPAGSEEIMLDLGVRQATMVAKL